MSRDNNEVVAERFACDQALAAFFRRKAPAHDRDDLKQEVWLRLCRRPPPVLSRGLCAYVLGIARHVLCRYYRQRGASEASTAPLCETEPRLAAPATHEVGDWTPGSRLRLLSRADQELLELRYEHELSLAELADFYAIPKGTVKSRLHHTHERLRGLLQPAAAAPRRRGGAVTRPGARLRERHIFS